MLIDRSARHVPLLLLALLLPLLPSPVAAQDQPQPDQSCTIVRLLEMRVEGGPCTPAGSGGLAVPYTGEATVLMRTGGASGIKVTSPAGAHLLGASAINQRLIMRAGDVSIGVQGTIGCDPTAAACNQQVQVQGLQVSTMRAIRDGQVVGELGAPQGGALDLRGAVTSLFQAEPLVPFSADPVPVVGLECADGCMLSQGGATVELDALLLQAAEGTHPWGMRFPGRVELIGQSPGSAVLAFDQIGVQTLATLRLEEADQPTFQHVADPTHATVRRGRILAHGSNTITAVPLAASTGLASTQRRPVGSLVETTFTATRTLPSGAQLTRTYVVRNGGSGSDGAGQLCLLDAVRTAQVQIGPLDDFGLIQPRQTAEVAPAACLALPEVRSVERVSIGDTLDLQLATSGRGFIGVRVLDILGVEGDDDEVLAGTPSVSGLGSSSRDPGGIGTTQTSGVEDDDYPTWCLTCTASISFAQAPETAEALGGFDPVLSADGGTLVTAISEDDGSEMLVATDLASGVVTPVAPLKLWNGPDVRPSVSADGNLIAFVSDHSMLDPDIGDTRLPGNLYLHDRAAQTTQLLSITDRGDPFSLERGATRVSISGDGTTVAYDADTRGVVIDDDLPITSCTALARVLVLDVASGEQTRVSGLGEDCEERTGARRPDLSGDGTTVVFEELATATGDDAGVHVVLVDLTTGDRTILTEGADGPSGRPTVNADGSTVVFQSIASNLGASPESGGAIYRYDRGSDAVSVVMDRPGEAMWRPQVADSGEHVVFRSTANLAGPADAPRPGFYRMDLGTGDLDRVDVTAEGQAPSHGSPGDEPGFDIAADGSVVVRTRADNLVDAPPGSGGVIRRFAGLDDAITGAVAISQQRFATAGSFAGARAAQYAVLATAESFADALSGAVLGADGPLLFSRSATMDERTATEIDRVLGGAGLVYVLGGEAALSADVAAALTTAGYTVERLAGPSRFETSTAIAAAAIDRFGGGDAVALARAFGPADNPTAAWADSVTGGGWAADTGIPIVLTPTDGLHPAAAALLDEQTPTTVHLLGGPAALADSYDSLDGSQRTSGATRFDTARQIASSLWGVAEEGARSYLVLDITAELGWTYGLAGAGLAADLDAPLIGVAAASNPPETLATVVGCGDAVALAALGPLAPGLLDALDDADAVPC